MLAPIVVNSVLDNGDGGNTTLREAIDEANVNPDHDMITFDPAVFNAPKKILLTQGELFISESVTIDGTVDGAGPSNVSLNITIDGNGQTSGPFIQSNGQVEFNSLTFTGGRAGAIQSFGNFTVRNCTITGNTRQTGAGIYGRGILNVVGCTISGNTSTDYFGGGIYFTGSQLNIVSTTITGNQATDDGGGLFASVVNGSLTIDRSTITLNKSISLGQFNNNGGGIKISASNASVTITDTIISENEARGTEANVGGVEITANSGSNILLDQVSIFRNHADDDVGGIVIASTASATTVRNSIVSGNTVSFSNRYSYDAAAGFWFGAYSGGSNMLENCTISENRTTKSELVVADDKVYGGGLFIRNAVVVFPRFMYQCE